MTSYRNLYTDKNNDQMTKLLIDWREFSLSSSFFFFFYCNISSHFLFFPPPHTFSIFACFLVSINSDFLLDNASRGKHMWQMNNNITENKSQLDADKQHLVEKNIFLISRRLSFLARIFFFFSKQACVWRSAIIEPTLERIRLQA